MKIYLAHPYGGDEYNIELAGMLARELEKTFPTWTVISPLHLFSWKPYEKDHYMAQMWKCLEVMLSCDALYLADGWEMSLGCRMERAIAKEHGMPIYWKGHEGKWSIVRRVLEGL